MIIFPRFDGDPWRDTDWRNWRNWRRRTFAPATRRLGLDGVRPYDLRHSFVSLLIAEGRSIVEVARQAGYSPTVALDTSGTYSTSWKGPTANPLRTSFERLVRPWCDLIPSPSPHQAMKKLN